jgi:peptidyl-prolyl cis-trans isomerase B (cyclophilin B)
MTKKYGEPPAMQVDLETALEATLDTSQGSITLHMDPSLAPKTVNNFVFLAREGFYEGTIIHRVIPKFMIQGGDPTGTGRGGPGYQFADETNNGLTFDRPGLLAMANAGPNTNGSQFFITEVPTPHLNGKHTIFGEVTEGFDVVKKIANAPTGDGDKPREDVVIRSIQIQEKKR